MVRTAPVGSGLLPGITRALLFEALDEAGIPWVEETVPLARFGEAEEAFLTSSSREVLPIGWFVDLEALSAYRRLAARRLVRPGG